MPKVNSAKEEGLMDGGFEGWMDGGFVGRWKQQMVDLKDGGFQGWMDGGSNGWWIPPGFDCQARHTTVWDAHWTRRLCAGACSDNHIIII